MNIKPTPPLPSALIIAHIRCPGFEYIGKIDPGPPEDKDDSFYLYVYQALQIFPYVDARTGDMNLEMKTNASGLYEEPILLPRSLCAVLAVDVGTALWNKYRNAIGEQIQVEDSLPPGTPPPPGARNLN